jgi:hypothetical protein
LRRHRQGGTAAGGAEAAPQHKIVAIECEFCTSGAGRIESLDV